MESLYSYNEVELLSFRFGELRQITVNLKKMKYSLR